jgi:hypothetical protein
MKIQIGAGCWNLVSVGAHEVTSWDSSVFRGAHGLLAFIRALLMFQQGSATDFIMDGENRGWRVGLYPTGYPTRDHYRKAVVIVEEGPWSYSPWPDVPREVLRVEVDLDAECAEAQDSLRAELARLGGVEKFMQELLMEGGYEETEDEVEGEEEGEEDPAVTTLRRLLEGAERGKLEARHAFP